MVTNIPELRHILNIPATDAGAVFAHGEAVVIGEHRLRFRALLEREIPLGQLEALMDDVHVESQKSLEKHVARLHGTLPSRALAIATDLDAARANTGRISAVAPHHWMLGYCAGCAGIQSVRELARLATTTIDQRMRYELRELDAAHEQAQSRWNACVDRMLSSRPWINRDRVLFELVDIASPEPKFRISERSGR